jgi:hypothetical protein
MPGNVFLFSFDENAFESIVNLTAIDETFLMAKMGDEEKMPKSVNSILTMVSMRARFNEHRRMEVWLLKLSDEFTEEGLWEWSQEDPQAVADLARMGEHFAGVNGLKRKAKIL